MIITFPSLSKKEKFGRKSQKNEIRHLIEIQYEIDCSINESSEHHLIIQDKKGKKYCIVIAIDVIVENYEYKLLANTLQIDELILLQWLMHPQLNNYNPDIIVDSWKDAFNFKEENIADNIIGLREPQIGAIHSILGHLTNASEIATIVLPTGTGKTETMLSVLVAKKCRKLLVTVPSDSLRSQLANKFYDFGWLKKKDVNGKSIVDEDAQFPIVGILNTGFDNIEDLENFFNKCNVIISTMDLVAASSATFITKISELCTHLFIDEAHHSKASNWNKFIKSFDKNKILQFTATPFRNDGKMLDGKIIYNFSLKNAQEQGYFKEINFIPIREYYQKEADEKIAEVAVAKLREDIGAGYDHILMARCEDKPRAQEVFEIYQQYSDLSPILVYSGIPGKKRIISEIVNKEHKIIVCVGMLGEGFDLPELKIAAFHDIRKSLPITLQFAGRFTRTSRDSNLGSASFVANLHQPKINDVLSILYAKESNWNSILPTLSLQATQEQIDLQDFLSGFSKLDETLIPYQEIRPAFSAVAYKNQTTSWNPLSFHEGIKGYENYDYKFHDINRNRRTLIVLLGNKKNVEWGTFNDVYNIEWDIYIIYWEQRNNILFIHSSDKGSHYFELAKAIIGEEAVLIKDENVFKSFYKIDRIKLFNVGLRKGLGKNITFQAYYGKGVQEALLLAEERSGISNNVFGVGFENGDVTSIGCSRKGRIWSYSRGTINEFLLWCDKIGRKLSNMTIDPNDILLRNTIKPRKVSVRPQNLYPITVDWHQELYKEIETRIIFSISGQEFDLTNSELNIINADANGILSFALTTDVNEIIFELDLSQQIHNGIAEFQYNVRKVTNNDHSIAKIGSSNNLRIEDFFNEYPPVFWFADGSFLQANDYVQFNEDILLYPREDIIVWDWSDVDTRKESEKFVNIRTESIQYHFFQKLILDSEYYVIYNDDDSGEIADIVTIKDLNEEIKVEFYHLKYASGGSVTNDIKNLYEVCGQAQKSLIWKYKDGHKFINHLIKREFLKNKVSQTRLKKGTLDDLDKLLQVVKSVKPITYNIYIVQPGFSKQNASNQILNLLGVTANHLKKQGNIDLKVIASA